MVRVDECTTFGSPTTLGDDADIARAIALGSWPSRLETTDAIADAIARDLAISDHRWRGADRLVSGDYVPGDILRVRSLAATWLLEQATGDWQSDQGPRPLDDPGREIGLIQLLYAAVPYFLPASDAFGVLASHPPEADILSELRMPYPAVAVFFGHGLEIPETMRGGEAVLADRCTGEATVRDVLLGTVPPADQAPEHIRFGTLTAYRNETLSIVGVVLTADLDGGLGNLVAFILGTPVAPQTRFHIVEGVLDRSHLAPLIHNIAAAVTWGAWSAPALKFDLPDDHRSRAFRDAIRRGAFRRAEPHGGFGDVRVLDTARMHDRSPRRPGSGQDAWTAPATHLRRAHWHRYRVGPRHDWHYEVRWIPPVVVNPGGTEPRRTTVYRLPDPP